MISGNWQYCPQRRNTHHQSRPRAFLYSFEISFSILVNYSLYLTARRAIQSLTSPVKISYYLRVDESERTLAAFEGENNRNEYPRPHSFFSLLLSLLFINSSFKTEWFLHIENGRIFKLVAPCNIMHVFTTWVHKKLKINKIHLYYSIAELGSSDSSSLESPHEHLYFRSEKGESPVCKCQSSRDCFRCLLYLY